MFVEFVFIQRRQIGKREPCKATASAVVSVDTSSPIAEVPKEMSRKGKTKTKCQMKYSAETRTRNFYGQFTIGKKRRAKCDERRKRRKKKTQTENKNENVCIVSTPDKRHKILEQPKINRYCLAILWLRKSAKEFRLTFDFGPDRKKTPLTLSSI